MASSKQARTPSRNAGTTATTTRSPGSKGARNSAARNSATVKVSGTATGPGTAAGRSSRGGGQNGRSRSGSGPNARRRSGSSQAGGNRGSLDQKTAAQAPAAQQPGQADARQAAAVPARRPPARPVALWFQIVTLALSVCGLGVSVYLTITHYDSSVQLVCSDNGVVNCQKVTQSAESVVFGIFPVAVLGLAFYVFMTAINTPWAWNAPMRWVAWLRTAGIIAGIVFVLYLVFAEVILIGNICLWCTSVHGITFLLFILLMSVSPFIKKTISASGAR